MAEEEAEDSFFGKWHCLFEESFLEQELFDQLFEQMKSLLVYAPEERFLVHGDYGFNNLLADDGKITAVLDWANAQYGDFVYDIAWLDFYSPGVGYGSRFQQHYQAQNRPVPYFAERLRCYQCYISLNALRFYAKADLPEAYGWARPRILGIWARRRLQLKTALRILNYLGVAYPPDLVFGERKMKKQATELNERWAEKYRKTKRR